MTATQPLPQDHPIMVAWKAWRHGENGKDAYRWMSFAEAKDGVLWTAFLAGYTAGGADAAWVRECVSKMLDQRLFGFLDWDAQRLAIAALSMPPTPDGWRPHETVTDTKSGQWFFWRDPIKPDDWHLDQVCVENGAIVAKAGCGLDFFTDCQPCRFVDGAEAVIAAATGRS